MKPSLAHPLAAALCFLIADSAPAVEVDSSFAPDLPPGTVHAIAVNGDGEIFVGGSFADTGSASPPVIKLYPSGAPDPNFAIEGLDGTVLTMALGSEGALFVGGSFPEGVACVDANGTPRAGFSLPQGRVHAIKADSGDGIVVGGSFWSDPGIFAARLAGDGTVDEGFSSGLRLNFSMEAGVCALAVQSDGKIIAGGNFDTEEGFTTVARLNPDGSVDSSFSEDHGPILYPKAIMALTDGKILVAGTADSTGRGFVRRLNPDGSIDPDFTEVSTDRQVETFDIDSLGRIVIGGSFQEVNGSARERLARLNPDGTLDAEWNVGADNVVKAVVCEPSGTVLVGGAFSSIGGIDQQGLARLKERNGFGFRPLSLTTSGEMHLSLKGEPGQTYIIESSGDLSSWTVFKTNIATAGGLIVSTSASEAPRQFFRARETR